MAMLEEIYFPHETLETSRSIRRKIATQAWDWFYENHDETVLSIMWVVKVKVRDVRHLFVLLFGDDPRNIALGN